MTEVNQSAFLVEKGVLVGNTNASRQKRMKAGLGVAGTAGLGGLFLGGPKLAAAPLVGGVGYAALNRRKKPATPVVKAFGMSARGAKRGLRAIEGMKATGTVPKRAGGSQFNARVNDAKAREIWHTRQNGNGRNTDLGRSTNNAMARLRGSVTKSAGVSAFGVEHEGIAKRDSSKRPFIGNRTVDIDIQAKGNDVTSNLTASHRTGRLGQALSVRDTDTKMTRKVKLKKPEEAKGYVTNEKFLARQQAGSFFPYARGAYGPRTSVVESVTNHNAKKK